MLAGLLLFGASFGYVEAAVVVYLRDIYEPFVQRFHPQYLQGDLFPMLSLDQLSSGPSYLRLLKVEVIREAATIAMLAGIGWGAGWNFRTRFAAFLVAFGIWDVGYYLFLK